MRTFQNHFFGTSFSSRSNLHDQQIFTNMTPPLVEVAQLRPRSACHVEEKACPDAPASVQSSYQHDGVGRLYVGAGKATEGLKLDIFWAIQLDVENF